MLTGGDPIRARFMRQDEFEFLPQLKLLISGNHKPGLRSVDEAIRRRFHLIPFTVTIPPDERDHDLTEKLKTEWPAILGWMIDGCVAWQREDSTRRRSAGRHGGLSGNPGRARGMDRGVVCARSGGF